MNLIDIHATNIAGTQTSGSYISKERFAADPRNAEVLFPYLNGEDLNSRPDASASRWVIDFNDRNEAEAAEYTLPYQRVLEQVKPERLNKSKAVSESPWWRFLRTRGEMRQAISDLSEVLVIALVSKTVMPLRIKAGQVFSHKLGVFATGSYNDQALLSSSVHYLWTVKYTSTMRNDVNYSPSDVFETFPRPQPILQLSEIGRTLDTERREIMIRRGLGLTKLYNLVNDRTVASSGNQDIARMRDIQRELDESVLVAYGWNDIPLEYGFFAYRNMERWTVNPAARTEILDRLLEENLRRSS
ncbi:MAG: hypothetical protein LBL92_01105 [Propionibacteriaceae bacterium]|nr:hypothetical protein [Propionibacteriaceae bacterium]